MMFDDRKEALRAKINELVKISSIPSILKKIMDITENGNSSVTDLEAVIEHDQALALRIMGISNAVFYGFPRKISSISQAILVLGFEMVKGLAISMVVFKGISGDRRNDVAAIWQHSFEVALASTLLAQKTGLISKDTAFLAGLLHDIGRPIIFQVHGKNYLEVSAPDSAGLIVLEEESFGAAHPEAGAWFADKCKLPEDCVAAIRYHHDPEIYRLHAEAAERHLSCLVPLVYLADLIVSDGNSLTSKYTVISPDHAFFLKSLNIKGEVLKEINETVDGLKDQIRAYYN